MAYLDQSGLEALWAKVKNWTNSVHANSMTKSASSQDGLQLMLKNGAQTPVTLATVTITKSDITALGIPASDTKYSTATQSANGLMSAADKKKLDGVAEGANKYVHPTSAAGAKSSGLYKVATDAQGHVTGATAVTKDDISPLESDPTVPAWAKAATKPAYKASEIELDIDANRPGITGTVANALENIDTDLTNFNSKLANFELIKANKDSPEFKGTPKAPTAAAGTNTTQIATTAFVHSVIAEASTGAAKYQGGITSASYQSLTTYKAGWYWVVTEAGTIAGEACEIGDMVFCNTDNTASGTKSNAHFDVVQNNIDSIPLSVINALS